MPDDDIAQFDCSQCGRLFRWMPKLAGKAVRCPCGVVLTCPEHPTIGPEPILEAIPLDPPPRPRAAAAQAATVEAPPVQKVSVRRVQSPDARPKLIEPGIIRDLYMPLALLGGGIAVELIAVALTSKVGYLNGLIALGEDLGVQVALMLVSILAAAKVRHFTLGSFPAAVLKVLAIAVSVPAAITFVSPILNHACMGYLVGWLGSVVMYFTLLGALFDLNEPDVFDCMGVIFFVYVAMFMFQQFVLKQH